MMQRKSRRGFTLIEVLVVVLIIGVLAAIALPMYNRAVLRSRFNALMPIVKAMNDSNEAYYLEHGNYASNPQDLPVQGQSSYPTGTELEFGNNMDYAYVLASNASAKNNYIMYQKHSTNYPGEIHCEAITGDDLAEYICESAGGTQNLGTTLTEGYTTYVLIGEGAGFPPGYDAPNCDAATAMGYTCNMSTNEQGQTVKQVCTTLGTTNFCRTKTYNEDGSYTSVTCQANSENVCTVKWYSATYDENGNKLTYRSCSVVTGGGKCQSYDASGSYDYTYDANGKLLTQRRCKTVNSSGNCTAYNANYSYDYTYDANGNKLTERQCSSIDSSWNCTAYSASDAYDYTYDANGNQLAERECSSVDSSGNCTAYSSTWNYTYDENGNQLTKRKCNSADSNGNCTSYDTIRTFNYTYDENGNQLTKRWCSSYDSSGNCTVYGTYMNSYDYTYDANGNQLSQRLCSSMNSRTGKCTAYSSATEYTYDDNGKQLTHYSCSGSRLNTSTGKCTEYSISIGVAGN